MNQEAIGRPRHGPGDDGAAPPRSLEGPGIPSLSLGLGALWTAPGDCEFRVWAPRADRVEVHLLTPTDRLLPMRKDDLGYHTLRAERILPGTEYTYRLDGQRERPDPASRWQPRGIHGPSRVVDSCFEWTDAAWRGRPLRDFIIYELHVGTFSDEGTFDGVAAHLPRLQELGITALELMPVAQFPGARNWGYDGVYPFAVQDSYGGPAGLKRLVDAAHRHGLAVVLDVVYNHLGPEGNYFAEFAPYFTDRYRTPWGRALNFDGPHSDEVRRLFIENARHWQTEYHLDGLRLDAVHAIHDASAVPFLEELAEACQQQAQALARPFHLVAESDLNSARHTWPRARGGYGLDAQWSDDFHHCLHGLLTGERAGYYADFGDLPQLAKVWREGYAFTGEYSRYRRRRHGSSPRANAVKQFVVCSQNHDQIGNRRLGDRLSATLSLEQQKLAAGAVLLSPFVPLLFMGEEYGETAPFQYFVSHTDAALIEAVRRGRREEFAAFGWQGDVPDPQAEATFERSKLNHARAREGHHQTLREFYRELLRLRQQLPAIIQVQKETLATTVFDRERVLWVRQWCPGDEILLFFHFASQPASLEVPLPAGPWRKELDSAETRWGGPGATAPATLPATARARLTLPAASLVVYQHASTP
jgi:maltooligosyltrehalose trehalohydrolase